ncbi:MULTISPECIES: hypothetical protein [Streptomyces]|uniref:Nos9 n=2 Tax=Streptomyces TaxID=1883 RepID=C6FX61_STRAS|nr:hypothetical protein [Streptomyces actuosus]ACR48351.1 Nos9 [Streptomyces actuosus]AWT44893.1 hypothetical protein DMT42_23115 [Streptomyces actuosus]MBM4821448.1 hypothetical protein [Streptomyces actuosus]
MRHRGTARPRGAAPTTTALLAAVAALTALTGCGGSDDGAARPDATGGTVSAAPRPDPRTADALRAVERAVAGAGSARISSTTAMGDLLSTRTEGALDWAGDSTGTLRITYTGGSLTEPLRKLGTTTMEARLLPDAYYARVGEDFARRMGGRHWIRYDFDDLAELPGDSGAYLRDQLRDTAPVLPVRLLLASGTVRETGRETVGGRATRHYTGTVDVSALGDVALRRQLTDAGVTAEQVDIWVDEKNLLVKKVEKAEMTSGPMTQTAYYDTYGVRVAVQRPPDGDTEDFEALMGGQGS